MRAIHVYRDRLIAAKGYFKKTVDDVIRGDLLVQRK